MTELRELVGGFLVIPALNGLPGPWSARFADLELDAELHRCSAVG